MKDSKYNEVVLQYNRAITYDPKNPKFYCNRAEFDLYEMHYLEKMPETLKMAETIKN